MYERVRVRSPNRLRVVLGLIGPDALFFHTIVLLAFLLSCALVLYLEKDLAYRSRAAEEITEVLDARNFPSSREQHHAIVNFAAQLLVPSSPDTIPPRVEQLHGAFRELGRAVTHHHNPKSAAEAISAKLASLTPEDRSLLSESLRARLIEFDTDTTHIPVERCDGSDYEDRFNLYGPPVCDPPGLGVLTHLLIAPRQTDVVSGGFPDLPAYVLGANDLSWALEDLLVALRVQADTLSDDGPDLVAAYFISPSGVLRYWDRSRKPVRNFLKAADFMGASPLVAEPDRILEDLLKKSRAKDRTREQIDLTDEVLRETKKRLFLPYIDYGENGTIRTRITPILDPMNRLVGVFCTDETIRNADPDTIPNSRWRLRREFSELANCAMVTWDEKKCESDDALSLTYGSLGTPMAAIAKYLCEAASENKEILNRSSRYRNNDGNGAVVFILPLQRFESSYDLLLIEPKSPTPPLGSLWTLVAFVTCFLGILIARLRYHHDVADSARTGALLRDLPTGVVEVVEDNSVIFGNDRAEEVLGRRFRAFGSVLDNADISVPLESIVDSPALRPIDSSETGFDTIELADIEHDRRMGIASDYYVRLRSAEDTGGDDAPESSQDPDRKSRRADGEEGTSTARDHVWVHVKGSPLLDGGGLTGSFAMVERVEDDALVVSLENKYKSVRSKP